MRWLKKNTNLQWTGFYLGKAPFHADTSWMGKYSLLKSMGWGLAPVYVGRQLGRSSSITAAIGKTDAANAAQLARRAQLSALSVLYLDIETGGELPDAMVRYYCSWCAGLKTAGFNPGVYCSPHKAAAQLARAFAPARVWVCDTSLYKPPPDFRNAYPRLDPAQAGYPGASVLQLAQDLSISAGRKKIRVDLDSATTADPSVL